MKIGIVCFPTFGGSGVVATELGKGLAQKGHQVHFLSYQTPVRLGHVNQNLYFHEVRVSNYPLFEYPPYELVLTSRIVEVAKFAGLDLVHVHYAIPHASAAYMAKKILQDQGVHLPIITTLHGTDITLVGRDPSMQPTVEFAINHSDYVTAVSESLRIDTEKEFKIDKKIEVIPNFICLGDFEDLNNEELRKQFAPNGEKILVHASNFRKVKRVEDVVQIFDRVRKQTPSKLILIGDGPERTKVESLCRSLGTCSDIIFLGKLKATEEILGISDVFILPSEKESFGLAALEAMACGVPVISSNTGGIPEVNIHGQTGYLSDVGNIEEMAFNTAKILTNEGEHERMKKGALQQASQFDIESILPMYEKIYEYSIEKENKLA